MEPARKYPIDYRTSLLSAFDIGGLLIMSHANRSLNDQCDMDRLATDLKILNDDYHNVCEKLVEEVNNE